MTSAATPGPQACWNRQQRSRLLRLSATGWPVLASEPWLPARQAVWLSPLLTAGPFLRGLLLCRRRSCRQTASIHVFSTVQERTSHGPWQSTPCGAGNLSTHSFHGHPSASSVSGGDRQHPEGSAVPQRRSGARGGVPAEHLVLCSLATNWELSPLR